MFGVCAVDVAVGNGPDSRSDWGGNATDERRGAACMRTVRDGLGRHLEV